MLFGNLFDFNGDGRVDWMEEAAEVAFLGSMMEIEEDAEDDEDTFDDCF